MKDEDRALENLFCSRLSSDMQEPFVGTAPYATIWLLLEFTGRWERRGVQECELPSVTKEWLAQISKQYPRLRIQLIRQHDKPLQKINCYVALSGEDNQSLYHFKFPSYQELPVLPLEQVINEEPAYRQYRETEPLFLVCTHGKRDACCARFGIPAYQAFRAQVGERAWQTSHVGGDKFAPNVLMLPYGINYGRVREEDVHSIVQAYKQDRILAHIFRGRTCYAPIVQAAEYYMRQYTGFSALSAFLLHECEEDPAGYWQVSFVLPASGIEYTLTLKKYTEYHEQFGACTLCNGKDKCASEYYMLLAFETKRLLLEKLQLVGS